MPRKVFVANEILTAADVNTNLMDQAVMTFAGTAARGSAIPSPSEGMVTYLSDVNSVEVYTGAAFVPVPVGAGSILQVVQTLKTDTFTTASDTFVTVTGTTATITPRATSSKVLVLGTMMIGSSGTSNNHSAFVKIVGGNTSAYLGDAAGDRVQAVGTPGSAATQMSAQRANGFTSLAFLDSPATTSAVTYSLELRRGIGSTAFLGSSGLDSDSAGFGRFPTTIILMEVAG
jgi:hypothetical protein